MLTREDLIKKKVMGADLLMIRKRYLSTGPQVEQYQELRRRGNANSRGAFCRFVASYELRRLCGLRCSII